MYSANNMPPVDSTSDVYTIKDIQEGIYGGHRIDDYGVASKIADAVNKVHNLGNQLGRRGEPYDTLASLSGELRTCAGIWSNNPTSYYYKEAKSDILQAANSIISATRTHDTSAASLDVRTVQRYYNRGK